MTPYAGTDRRISDRQLSEALLRQALDAMTDDGWIRAQQKVVAAIRTRLSQNERGSDEVPIK